MSASSEKSFCNWLNKNRYYDPCTARYISQDPAGLHGGLNSYAYVGAPTGEIDPLGLASKKYHRKDGTYGKRRGRPPNERDTGHGNRLDSPLCTTFYKLIFPDGSLSKWGVTGKSPASLRYYRKFLAGRRMVPIATGSRRAIHQLEREMIEIHGGPDNNETFPRTPNIKKSPEQIIAEHKQKNPCIRVIRKL
ncbi:RHS repeat-associated core domain-containing protein [Massilia genomosp. 1]